MSTKVCFCSLLQIRRKYLNRSTGDDVINILERHSKLDFPKAPGSLDCSGGELRRGFVSKQRRTIGNSGCSEYRLESWCNKRLWIRHLKFGFPCAMNDVNIFDWSLLFLDVRAGTWHPSQPYYSTTGRTIDWFYRLIDGIYSAFRIFLIAISAPRTKKRRISSKPQESSQKVAERVCVVLSSLWDM